MISRSEARKRALDLLYAADMHDESALDTLARADQTAERPTAPYAATLVRGVAADQAFIDRLLGEYARGWSLDRMPAVDRNVLRIGVWEIFHGEDVPEHVVLSEAVALVRNLSTDDSPVFVNGVLGGILRDRESIESTRAPAGPDEAEGLDEGEGPDVMRSGGPDDQEA